MISAHQTGLPSEAQEPISILIVDDELGMRETLVEIIRMMGYQADTAQCGREAEEKFAANSYNLALLDIHLPDTSGLELLGRLKQLDTRNGEDTLYIIATGFPGTRTAIEALNQGAYAYITKPLDLAEINAIFARAIDRQRLERENKRLLVQLTALSELTDTALATLDLEELLDRLLRSVTENLEVDAGAILLLDEHNRLRLRSAIALDSHQPQATGIRLGEGFVGRIASERRPLVMHAPELWEQSESVDFKTRGVQSALGVPLLSGGKLIGVAHVDSVTPATFPPEQVRLLQVLADRAAVVIDNARLFARERALRAEADALSNVAHALVERVSLRERLDMLAQYFLECTSCERCVILLREKDRLIPHAVHGVPKHLERLLLRQRLDVEEAPPALQRLLARGAPAPLRDVAASGVLPVEVARRWNIRSALLIPLQYRGQLTGVASLDVPGKEREFTNDQVRMARALASHATVAVETAKTFETQREIARTLQESLLSRAAQVAQFDVASRYVPASEVAQIGGDYFDFIEIDAERLGIVMGDVCGKGLAAAVYTAMAKYMLRAYAVDDPSPASVMTRLNRALHNQMSDECMFITLVFGVLNRTTGEFLYANAAHPHPLLYRPADGRFEELATTGGMVGALREMEYTEETVRMLRGDVLALFTDGVTEAHTSGELLGSEGVQEVLVKCGNAPAIDLANAIYNRALDYSGGNLKDDVAIVIIRASDPPGG